MSFPLQREGSFINNEYMKQLICIIYGILTIGLVVKAETKISEQAGQPYTVSV
ncbi:MAG: hypothetical protein JWQ27_2192 [Ferruginibacter sp.]|nr:hypothetical protein [Ferruginibacter sp.]